LKINCNVTIADVSLDENIIVIGSSEGVIRIIDISNCVEEN